MYGDLASYHLLVDPTTCRLAAVIDIGTEGIRDPAVDVAALLHVFGESLVAPHLRNQRTFDETILQQDRFWCATFDLQLTLLGLRQDDPSLLIAHVGAAARDLASVKPVARLRNDLLPWIDDLPNRSDTTRQQEQRPRRTSRFAVVVSGATSSWS